MVQNSHDELLMFEEQILKRLHSAQQRFQHAREDQMKRYYKGQVDALSVALHEMRTIKFEAGAELSVINFQIASERQAVPESSPVIQSLIEPAHEIVVIPEEELAVAPKRRGRRKKQQDVAEEPTLPKKRGRKPVMPPAPKTVYQLLAREAIDLKVLPRKASWFYHELLPHGIIKGLYQLEKTLEEDVAFREAIQTACEKKKAFVPAEEAAITGASVPEQPEETTVPAAPEELSEITTVEPAPEQAAAGPEKKRRRRHKQAETVPKEETMPKKRGRKPASHAVPTVSEFQQLAREAVDLGVFTRKASWFYHKLLPQGLIKGLYQLEKLLERDAVLREAIQAECAAKKAFVPAEAPLPVIEPAREPVVEPFQEAA